VMGFGKSDQELLLGALQGTTDPELAVKLCVSVSAIKKRWLSIFSRIEQVKPDLLPFSARKTATDAKRGLQRRHHILTYIRGHPEELRPYLRHRGLGSNTQPGRT
jgi:hypothetical protein